MSNTTTRVIYYIIIIGFVCVFINTIVSQVKMHDAAIGTEMSSSADTGGWYSRVDFVGNLLLMLASLYSVVIYRKHFPTIVTVCYFLMIILIAIGSFSAIGRFSKTPSLFFSPKGLGTWINFGILYFTAEEVYTAKIIKMFKIICFIFIAFNLGQIALLGNISNRDQVLNAIRETAVYVIWVYPFFFFDDSDKTNLAKIIKYGLILIVAFFAFAIASRSYLLCIIIFVLIKLKRDLKQGRSAMLIVAMTGMLLLAGYFLVANLQHFNSIKSLLNIFSGRIDDDTRTSQLKEFMDQYNYDKLFSGVGPAGTWNWSVHPHEGYEWLDNQFMLLTWWFGLQTCLIYMLFLVYPLFRKNTENSIAVTNAKIIIFFWILACGGFAIYVTFSSKLFYYFITLLIGIATLNIRRKTFISLDRSKLIYNRLNQWEIKKKGLSDF